MKIIDNKWIVSALLALLLVTGTVAGQSNIAFANDAEMSSSAEDQGYADDGMDNYGDESENDDSMQDEDTEETSSSGE